MDKEVNKGELGKRIKKIRADLGETAEVFGKHFKPNANRSLVSAWENGRYVPSPERLKKIAELGEMSVDELLYGDYKIFVYNTLYSELAQKGELFLLIVEYLQKEDHLLNKNANLINRKEIYEIRSKLFLEDIIEDIFKVVNTPKMQEDFINNQEEAVRIIVDFAVTYVDYRINRLTISIDINENVIFKHLKQRNFIKIDDSDNTTKYKVNYHISVITAEVLEEGASIDYKFDCYPSLTIILNKHNKKNNYYYFNGLDSFKNQKYKKIYGSKTYEQLKKILLADALEYYAFEEYNIHCFQERD